MRKKRRMQHLIAVSRITAIVRDLPQWALRTLALAGVFYICVNANCILAEQNQPDSASGGQMEVYAIGQDESTVYKAAVQESDPQKRALKLYEFIQKYPKSPLAEQISNEDYEKIKTIEEEYRAFYRAKQEPDYKKRADMLLEFHQKYPHSTLAENIRYEYLEMLKRISKDKKYELLESLGEQWLTVQGNDVETYALVAEAAAQLHKYQRCGECLEFVYEMKPSPNLAKEIETCYEKADNSAKQIEWAEKLFKMPEFDDDYMLRYTCMMRFYADRNLPKAAEYARLTLNSADLVKQENPNTKEQLRKVRRACHHIIASNLVAMGDYTGAIPEFEKAIEAEKYGAGYYGIGLCLDNKKKIEEAFPYYAAAELMGGEDAPRAKNRLEVLYKGLHNNTLVGIDKVYNTANKLLAEPIT